MIGKIITYKGSSAFHREVITIDAGIVIKETANQVRTTCIFGHITQVSKHSIIRAYEPSDREHVIQLCRKVRDVKMGLHEKMLKLKEEAQDEIDNIGLDLK